MKWRGLEDSGPSVQHATLREELEERKLLADKYVPPAIQAVNRQTVEELQKSGAEQRILPAGAQAPSFELPDHDGNQVSSASLLSQGRLVICFFRGRWCPFCVAQMEAMNAVLPQIRTAGANLVAVSPQTVRQGFFMHDQHGIRFPLLSDAENTLAKKFGLVYQVPAPQREVYSRTFVNLPFINNEAKWELPIPATYIVARESTIVYVHADADYTRRPEPLQVVEKLGL